MARRTLLPVAVVMLVIAGIVGAFGSGVARAQDSGTTSLIQATLDPGDLPATPAFVRLLRITLQPGGVSPLHTHPGPEFGRVEQGTVRVLVQGDAEITPAPENGQAQPVQDAPQNQEFVLRRGDQIVYKPGTALTFRNAGTVPAILLSAVVLPAGSQHPPGLVWVGQAPTEDDLTGVTSEILGDGVATSLPQNGAVFAVDQLDLAAGDPLPAAGPSTLYSLASGVFDFTIQSGAVQVSRIAEPGPRPNSPAGTAASLAPGDAAFFPDGVNQSARADASGAATFYRVTISAGSNATNQASPVAASGAPAEIAIAATAAPSPTPTTSPEQAASPEAESTKAPTEEAASPTATEAATVELGNGVYALATDDEVRVRDQPGTDSNAVNELSKGERVQITGDSESADGITWWPIVGVDDSSITGWVSGDFLEPDPNQQP